MNAESALRRIARALEHARLEAVLIGLAAAALQGAPVTTDDFDFFFRWTPRNLDKLRQVAKELKAGRFGQPFYPISRMIRIESSDLQVDFMPQIHGLRSFEGVRDRSEWIEGPDWAVRVADLKDIIKSKRAAKRPKDLAVLPVLEQTQYEKELEKKG
jgi:predicted nucleotidyltransferase